MTNNQLEWQSLLPDVTPYQAIFNSAAHLAPVPFAVMQARLVSALKLFCHPRSSLHFMLLKAQETREYLAIFSRIVREFSPKHNIFKDSHYVIKGSKISLTSTNRSDTTLPSTNNCLFQEWVEPEQLFGCVRFYKDEINLHPGLLHQANGGVLILTAHTLLLQPLLWLRLKQMITQCQFHWVSLDSTRSLPITIPPMPLELRLIIVGNHQGIAGLNDIEPELSEQAIYGEYEEYLSLNKIDDMSQWCGYVNHVIMEQHLPPLSSDVWPLLIMHAMRYSGDQSILPLSSAWITQQLAEASLYTEEHIITAHAFKAAMSARNWHESYLSERIQHEIELGQILIAKEGKKVGQINGLSILDYPGHPRSLGEPSRISCVVHFGDGEFTDVERKAELGGNLHAKGMMIMQAFLVSELKLNQQLPFSASIVFEQSYGEVDGDSASLAELCALISALSQKPIYQQIAVTGSVDQFGNVQPIGGVNEKVEGFFEVCLRSGLTGNQGVILPATNVRHLCLKETVVNAVREGSFHIWAVHSVAEALPLLTGYAYADKQQRNLLAAIQERITQVHTKERFFWPWLLRWCSWLNHD
ncbi:AAA family ATPase [Candidatus Gillettellia adelgis]